MPLYYYICDGCKIEFSDIRNIANRNDVKKCSKCGANIVRNSGIESPSIRGRDYNRPIHSDSLAISPSQIAEHKKLFPNIEIDNEGRPIFDNYRRHDDYLEKCGFDKKEQRIKPKGRRIDKPKQPSK